MATKRRWLIAVTVVCVAVAGLLLFSRPQQALTPPEPGETLLAASQGLDEIGIDAVFDPTYRTVTVNQTFTLTNRTGTAQRLMVFRTYANAFQYEDTSPAATTELYDKCYVNGFSEGRLTFSYVKLQTGDGEPQGVAYSYGDDAHTALRVSLPQDWAVGETITFQMGYTLLVPELAYRFGVNDGIWALGNAFVIPSPFWDGAYREDEYVSIGDPFISECADYTVRFTAPDDYTVAGGGTATRTALGGGQTMTVFQAPAIRSFAACLSTRYRTAQAMQDGVLLQAYALSDANAKTLLQTAGKALACFNERFGAYPYPCFSLCETGFPFAGMEYPTLVYIGSSTLSAGGDELEKVIVHEVAHQWWCGVLGSDEFNQPWQDEALCQFSLLDYWGEQYGQTARRSLQYTIADASMLVTIPRGVTPGSPVDYFGDMDEYSVVVYERGAAALCALDTAMNGTLDGFLADYYDTYAFRLATREDFETLLKTYTGEDWSPLLSDYLDTYIDN